MWEHRLNYPLYADVLLFYHGLNNCVHEVPLIGQRSSGLTRRDKSIRRLIDGLDSGYIRQTPVYLMHGWYWRIRLSPEYHACRLSTSWTQRFAILIVLLLDLSICTNGLPKRPLQPSGDTARMCSSPTVVGLPFIRTLSSASPLKSLLPGR